MWFRADDFDFLARRSVFGAGLSIWQPHNDHWSTLPILLYRALYSIFGLGSAKPYLVCLFVAHLAVAHVLWRVMRRVGVEPFLATGLAAVFALLGAGGPDILWEFQIGFVSSVLLGWIFIVLANREGALGARDLGAGAVGVAALMTSSVAIVMLFVGGLVALVRRGWRIAVVLIGPLVAIYLSWYLLAAQSTYRPGFPLHFVILNLPGYVYTGLTSAMTGLAGPDGIGPVLLVLLALWALTRSSLVPTPAAPALLGVVGAVSFYLFSAFGPDAASAASAANPRYSYVAIALSMPAIGLALTSLVDRSAARIVAVLGVILLAGIWNYGALLQTRSSFSRQSQLTKQQLIAAARIAETESVIPGTLPLQNLGGHDLLLSTLESWAHRGILPAGVHPSNQAVLDAASEIQLDLTRTVRFPSAAASQTAPGRGYLMQVGVASCSGSPRIRRLPDPDILLPEAASSLGLYSPSARSISVRLISATGASDARPLVLPAGRSYLNLATSKYQLEVVAPAQVGAATCTRA